MSPKAIIREALKTLLRNRMRSTLTVLGVTIGIAAVICVVAIGQAGSREIQAQLDNLGDNLVTVEAGGLSPGGIHTGGHATKTLILADAEAIQREIRQITRVSPHVNGSASVVYGNRNWSTSYRGVSFEYFEIRRWMLASGAAFTQADVEGSEAVCVLGATVAERLFPLEDPVGRVVRIKSMPCQVSGVLAAKGQSAGGHDQDDTVLLPYTTAQKQLRGITWLDDLMLSASSAETVQPAIQQITMLLRERHRIRPGQEDDFHVREPADHVQARLEASRTFTLLLIVIASVSLLVGGIGIMNVMLVSVTERTREIGVRLAVGATEQHVQAQFLGEAIILSLFGGVLGVALGAGGCLLLGHALAWSMQLSAQAMLWAAVFSVAVGVFFGFYPARLASRLDPVEALRFE